jgi:hypothetical protein
MLLVVEVADLYGDGPHDPDMHRRRTVARYPPGSRIR